MSLKAIGSAISKTNTSAGTPSPAKSVPSGVSGGRAKSIKVDDAKTMSGGACNLGIGKPSPKPGK